MTTPTPTPDQGKWHGIPRQEIPWFPTIDEKACINCGLCYVTCGRLVFEMDEEKRKAVVVEPYRCMVGVPLAPISVPRRQFISRNGAWYRRSSASTRSSSWCGRK